MVVDKNLILYLHYHFIYFTYQPDWIWGNHVWVLVYAICVYMVFIMIVYPHIGRATNPILNIPNHPVHPGFSWNSTVVAIMLHKP